jgi:hypothetical protein
MNRRILTVIAIAIAGVVSASSGPANHDALHVLAPITHGNLTIFPVVGGADYDTSRFLTLDEGVRAGSVVVTEQGAATPLMRRGRPVHSSPGAQVNELVLINNSDRPLLLLAGEIVTGGKQDRVIGSDRLVPPKSDPIALSVFCVEPGRWTGRSNEFGSMKSQMAQPSVRVPAMAAKNQQEVWNEVASARDKVATRAAAAGNPAPPPPPTSSYAVTMAAPLVQQAIDGVVVNYDGILRELRKANAKGVVVAINGNLVWADLFASNDLLSRYWQKLARSYAAESLTTASAKGGADQKSAQAFLDRLSGNREVVETEPGVYRRAEIDGDGYKVFTLTSLTPKTDFDVHVAKMTLDPTSSALRKRPMAIE